MEEVDFTDLKFYHFQTSSSAGVVKLLKCEMFIF